MEVSINIIKQGKHVLIAACDLDLLGKTLKFGKLDFRISQSFYGGFNVSVDEAIDLIKQGTTVNIIGSVLVKKAIEEGVIHPKAVIEISGIPHAQIVRL